MADKPLVLGTRSSRLALWQAHFIEQMLESSGASVEIRKITTTGDRVQDVPISQLGDQALFTKELDVALIDGRIDLAVHSLKDLPTRIPDELVIAAIGEREEPWDAFVAHPSFEGRLADLPEGARVATSSLRRTAQLKARRPDVEVVPVRGNVPTRLDKLDESSWHGMVLAAAGLLRLDMEDRIRERIDPDVMLPAVSQGALGVVCRRDDEETYSLLAGVVHHEPTGAATRAERAFLRRLEGGCQVPVGAYGRLEDGELVLDGCVVSLDGSRVLRDRTAGPPDKAEELGWGLAGSVLDAGADAILTAVRQKQDTLKEEDD